MSKLRKGQTSKGIEEKSKAITLCIKEKARLLRLAITDKAIPSSLVIENNKLKDGDYFECPKRATCKFNGVLCQAPKHKGNSLTEIEIKLMKLTSTVQTNETIAINLELALGSFHKLKQALYEKLGVQTKQEVALIAKSLNII